MTTLGFLVVLVAQADGGGAIESNGTVTLPLQRLLELERLGQKDEKPPEPPRRYVVSELSGDARIIDDALEAEITVQLSVLNDGWVSVPLLEPDEALSVVGVPTIADGHLAMGDEGLRFITEKKGNYRFVFSILRAAKKGRSEWTVEIKPSTATARRLRFRYNDTLFSVTSPSVRRDGDALVTFAERGRWRLSWTRNSSPVGPVRPAERPPVDPVVTRMRSSVVLTLDGQEIARHHFDLRLDAEETLRVKMPPGQSLTKVYVNGVPRRIDKRGSDDSVGDRGSGGDEVELRVAPARPGEPAGAVELVTEKKSEAMQLAGTLGFELPAVDWSVNEAALRMHLPSVFNYAWSGGSLSPNRAFDDPEYTHSIPTPGKRVDVSQQLVTGAANAVVDYTVNLEGKFFR